MARRAPAVWTGRINMRPVASICCMGPRAHPPAYSESVQRRLATARTAPLRCGTGGRLTRVRARRSDRLGESVNAAATRGAGEAPNPSPMAASRGLHKRVPGDDHLCCIAGYRSVPYRRNHRIERGGVDRGVGDHPGGPDQRGQHPAKESTPYRYPDAPKTNTSMTCPCWSTGRYAYRHPPLTLTYASPTNHRSSSSMCITRFARLADPAGGWVGGDAEDAYTATGVFDRREDVLLGAGVRNGHWPSSGSDRS